MTQTERILAALDQNGPMKRADLVALLEEHIAPASLDACLNKLTTNGSLMRLQDGRYTLGDGAPVKVEQEAKPTASAAPEPLTGAVEAFARAVGAPPPPKATKGVLMEAREEFVAQIGGMRIVITGTSPFLAHKALAAALEAML